MPLPCEFCIEGDYSEIKCNCCPNCKCLDAKFVSLCTCESNKNSLN
ncbi:hypothetical protein D910_09276 [Dendroctonus ponderosae]